MVRRPPWCGNLSSPSALHPSGMRPISFPSFLFLPFLSFVLPSYVRIFSFWGPLQTFSKYSVWIVPPVDVFLTYLWGKVNPSFSSSAILTSYLFLNFSTSCSERISGDLNIYSKHSTNGTERLKRDHDWCKMDPGMQTIKQHLSNSFHRMIVRPDVSWC